MARLGPAAISPNRPVSSAKRTESRPGPISWSYPVRARNRVKPSRLGDRLKTPPVTTTARNLVADRTPTRALRTPQRSAISCRRQQRNTPCEQRRNARGRHRTGRGRLCSAMLYCPSPALMSQPWATARSAFARSCPVEGTSPFEILSKSFWSEGPKGCRVSLLGTRCHGTRSYFGRVPILSCRTIPSSSRVCTASCALLRAMPVYFSMA
jgi:hypothetical protein